jgi:hypothetical protein
MRTTSRHRSAVAQARVRQTGGGLTGEQILELLHADRAERK